MPESKRRHSFKSPEGPSAIALLLALLTLVLRLVFAARQPTEWDSVHYLRALDHFNVVEYWPHAPGYWLYIFLGRVVRWLTPFGDSWSLIIVAALASAGTVAVAYLIGVRVADRRVGLACAFVMMTNPFMWFYGSIVATKSFDALALLLLLLFAYRASPRAKYDVAACVVLGLIGGVRPSAMVIFFPIVLYSVVLSVRSVKRIVICLVAGAVSIAAWMIPMSLEQPGGLSVVQRESNHLLKGSLDATSVLVGAPGASDNAWSALGVTATALLPIMVLTAMGVLSRLGRFQWRQRTWLPLLIATVPGVCEAFFIHFSTAGYALSFLPGLIMLLVLPLGRVPVRKWTTVCMAVLVLVVCAYQVQRFTMAPYVLPQSLAFGPWDNNAHGAPFASNYAEELSRDHDAVRYRALRNTFDPSRDVFVFVTGNGDYRYRYTGYQTPEFTMHLVANGLDVDQARNERHTTVTDKQIEIPDGGHAILVVDNRTADIEALLDNGSAAPVHLSTKPMVYMLKPGTSAFGVNFVTAPLPAI